MKKNYYSLIMLSLALLLISCGSDNTKINSKLITKLYNEKASELCMNKQYTTIDTGYYELNDESGRLMLQRLAHAGVIEYNVERFAWYNKCIDIKYTLTKIVDTYCENTNEIVRSQNVFGTDTVISYDLEEHFMVSVRISPKFKSMLVDKIPEPTIEDKDMVLPKYKDWAEDLLENNESWPVLSEPKVPEIPHESKYIKCSEPKERVSKETTPRDTYRKEETKRVKYPICAPMDPTTAENFNNAKEREAIGSVHILGYEIKAVKACNIQTLTKEDGSLGARCEVIVKSNKVTPQGHLLMNHIIDNIPAKTNITLTYYVDKGWVIDTNDENKFSVPEIDPQKVIVENNEEANEEEEVVEEN